MILRICLVVAAGFAAFLAPLTPAAAWGPIGHSVSADLAERNISGHTRAQIALILGAQTLREASTVPDEQRENPDPFWQAAAPWHYINVPRDAALADITHPERGDAVTALDRFVATLRDPAASQLDKQRALQFVVHLVADLHLPVHVGDDVYRGAGINVQWFGEQRTVHWIWDEGMIEQLRLSAPEYAERLAARTTPAQVLDWWDAQPSVWLEESHALQKQVYAQLDEILPADPDAQITLGAPYQYRWREVMETRLQQSGYRMAAYLDWIFAPQPG